tara:strand:- start:1555 stop:1734 length:180 start_codon:yes stop_codon:yes gene_type:complete
MKISIISTTKYRGYTISHESSDGIKSFWLIKNNEYITGCCTELEARDLIDWTIDPDFDK